jgi:UDPglucose 6-dehydrogenase
MKIVYIGGGFVGACSAAVSADSGHDTLVFDVDAEKVKKLSTDDRDIIQSCLHEQGLAELLIRNRSRIRFTTDASDMRKFIVSGLEAVFMCLPTPEKEGAAGETDLSYYEHAVTMIAPALAARDGGAQSSRLIIINKSTVPIRMIDYTKELFERQGVKNFGIVSNPEFLVEGKAVKDSLHPDRLVVGAETSEDFAILRRVYQRFCDSSTVQYIEVNPYEAAASKLLANFILFNKVVTSYDVLGRTCEYFPNLGYENIRKILIADPRIGKWGLYNSLYSGGSCFIKDAGSLAHQLEQAGTHANLIRSILEANVFQRDHFFGRAETEAHFDWTNKTVAILGVAFKQDTNDIRNSGAIGIIQQLIGAGAKEIKIFDPAAMDMCRGYFRVDKNELNARLSYHANEKEALADTDAAIICTDWAQFKALVPTFMEIAKRPYLIMDGRRMLQAHYSELAEAGYDVVAIGSPFMKGKSK